MCSIRYVIKMQNNPKLPSDNMSTTPRTFLYFAYGSNLLANRIHTNSPTAIRVGIAKLKDYRLDFGNWSPKWQGAVATIVPEVGQHVWGAVWRLDICDIPHLDGQECVAEEKYAVVNVNVETSENEVLNCRCYHLCRQPVKVADNEPIPEDRKPSLTYYQTILNGAVESKLPEDYIRRLKRIPHNGRTVNNVCKIMMSDYDDK